MLRRQVAWLQFITIVWMVAECSLSLIAAGQAHSVALLAFGSTLTVTSPTWFLTINWVALPSENVARPDCV